MSGYRIAVDYGTSNSAAAIADLPDGEAKEVRIGDAVTIPSVVVLGRSGLIGGFGAAANAESYPTTTAWTPKRRLGDPLPVIRATRSVDATEAASVTIRILLEAAAAMRASTAPAQLVVTHPADFGDRRQGALFAALRQAGVPNTVAIGMIAEPVAAALRYQVREPVAVGEYIAVYDLGAGTFDTAVLRRTDSGFDIDARGGDSSIGGELFDDILFEFLLGQVDPADADALRNATDPVWVDAGRKFRFAVRSAKEALSSTHGGGMDVPYPGSAASRQPLWLAKDELNEQLGAPLARTVDILDQTIERAGIKPSELRHVYLVGGSSKIPLIQTLVTERLGVGGRTYDDRKLVVSLGAAGAPLESIEWDRAMTAAPRAAAAVVAPEPATTPSDAVPETSAGTAQPVGVPAAPPPATAWQPAGAGMGAPQGPPPQGPAPQPIPGGWQPASSPAGPAGPAGWQTGGQRAPARKGGSGWMSGPVLGGIIAVIVLAILGVGLRLATAGATPTQPPPTHAPTSAPTFAPASFALSTRAPTAEPTTAPTDAPTDAPTLPTVAGPDADQFLLQAMTGRGDISNCEIVDSSDQRNQGIIASVNCDAPDPVGRTYYDLFDSTTSIAAYESADTGTSASWTYVAREDLCPGTWGYQDAGGVTGDSQGLWWCGTTTFTDDGSILHSMSWSEASSHILGTILSSATASDPLADIVNAWDDGGYVPGR